MGGAQRYCAGCLALGAIVAGILRSQALPTGEAHDSTAALRLVVTTDLGGRLDACGCRGDTAGGLPRLATEVKQLRASCTRMVLLDLGNLVFWPGQKDVVAESYHAIGYDAVLLTDTDRGVFEPVGKPETRMPWVAASASNDAPSYRILRLDGLAIAVVALPEDGDAAAKLVGQLRQEADVVCALCRLEEARALELASKVAPDVLCVPSATTTREGRTLIVGSVRGVRGVTVIDLESSADGRLTPETVRQVTLDESVEKDIRLSEMLQEYYKRSSSRTAPVDPPTDPVAGPDLSRIESLTPELCGACHPKQLAVWQNTRHASALSRLQSEGKLVPECVQCHSQQFRAVGRVGVPPSDGVTCTACHGDARAHAATRRAELLPPAPGSPVCVKCHTPEQQVAAPFDYEKALRAIAHREADGDE